LKTAPKGGFAVQLSLGIQSFDFFGDRKVLIGHFAADIKTLKFEYDFAV